MITCKEDLRNTQASGDLVVPFQELAFKLGIGWSPNGNDMVVRESYGVIVCRDFGYGLELAHRHNLKEGLKRLTLSDLKPRTKVEYEKVTDFIFDLKDEFESGLLFTKKFNQDWHQIKTEEQLGSLLSMNDDPTKNGIYRKVERPVEWWDDAVEYLNSKGGFDACGNKDEGLWIRFKGSITGMAMSREDWCDFARILLEQEGE